MSLYVLNSGTSTRGARGRHSSECDFKGDAKRSGRHWVSVDVVNALERLARQPRRITADDRVEDPRDVMSDRIGVDEARLRRPSEV